MVSLFGRGFESLQLHTMPLSWKVCPLGLAAMFVAQRNRKDVSDVGVWSFLFCLCMSLNNINRLADYSYPYDLENLDCGQTDITPWPKEYNPADFYESSRMLLKQSPYCLLLNVQNNVCCDLDFSVELALVIPNKR